MKDTRQHSVTFAATLGGLALLGIAMTTNQTIFSVKKNASLDTFNAMPSPSLKGDPNADHQEEGIRDFVLDGIEFAVIGAEATNQFGPYRQIGHSVSWLAQELSKPEDIQLLASKQPQGASLEAYPLLSSNEREMASWLLQNAPWTR